LVKLFHSGHADIEKRTGGRRCFFKNGFGKSAWVDVEGGVEGAKFSELRFAESFVLEEPRVEVERFSRGVISRQDGNHLGGGGNFYPSALIGFQDDSEVGMIWGKSRFTHSIV
jgi:hypothetical protein